MATFTLSIQSNLGLPRKRLLLTCPINNLLATGLYWVATHFPQWAGFFKKKTRAFKKVGFYKKKLNEKVKYVSEKY